jgi:hypothetical protein
MHLIILFIVAIYLLMGFKFHKPKEWSLPVKIIVHIFWLPICILIFILLMIDGGPRIM